MNDLGCLIYSATSWPGGFTG